MAGADGMSSPARVLGMDLRPFASGHELLLFASGAAALETPQHLTWAVLLCSRDASRFYRMLSPRHPWGMRFAIAGLFFRVMRAGINIGDDATFLRERAAFMDYMKAGRARVPGDGRS